MTSELALHAEAALARAGLGGASLVVRRLPPPGVVAAPGATGTVLLASIRPYAPFSPASMIKVPIAAALTARWAAGTLRPADRVTVAPANMTANDAPSPLTPGYEATLDELARLMLTRSDNVATNVLVDVLDRERITGYCASLGLRSTAVRRKLSGSLPLIDDPGASGRNAHPAGDAADLFAAIALDEVAGSAWLRDVLAGAEWNGKLNGGLRDGDRFAHKTGDTDEVSNDGGILSTAEGARYVVVVYAPVASGDGDDPRFAEVMRELRVHL
jgi:beta-lactamase class A